MSQNDISNISRDVWIPTWGTFGALGLCDKVDPSGLKIDTDKIETGTTGKLVLGDRFVSISGEIKIECRELTPGLVLAMMPWNSNSPIALNPNANVDLFSFAATLRLHPLSQSTDAIDLVLANAVPVQSWNMSLDGKSDNKWTVSFRLYPTRTGLATAPTSVTYGTAGGA